MKELAKQRLVVQKSHPNPRMQYVAKDVAQRGYKNTAMQILVVQKHDMVPKRLNIAVSV